MEIRKIENTNFEITSEGQIYIRGKLKKLYENKQGYLIVRIYDLKEKKEKTHYVHRLMGLTFLKDSQKREINHIDCNKKNNRLNNLEWVSSLENKKHAKLNGLYDNVYCSNNKMSKLTEEEVCWIRKNYKPKHKEFGCNKLAKKFKVSPATISFITNNLIWKNI